MHIVLLVPNEPNRFPVVLFSLLTRHRFLCHVMDEMSAHCSNVFETSNGDGN